jgi:uncharacterized protein YdcH (DUF465 family)
MPTDSKELREQLLKTDPEFRELCDRHSELDHQIAEMSAKPHLSEPEQLEEIKLKKRKLQLKDRIEDILRRHTGAGMASSPPMTASSPSRG